RSRGLTLQAKIARSQPPAPANALPVTPPTPPMPRKRSRPFITFVSDASRQQHLLVGSRSLHVINHEHVYPIFSPVQLKAGLLAKRVKYRTAFGLLCAEGQ